ncbi:hypothetical protein ACI2IY_19690 [Lysobacter enzymogenes]|uniref:hypothetical protein n=1 Tax=Lysobacter enzymogenes TaxID=69 RepID=UPI00384DC92C
MSNPAPASSFDPQDESHLKLLSIFYYVMAALGAFALVAVLGLSVLIFGVLDAGNAHGHGAPEAGELTALAVMMGLSAVLGLAASVLQFLTAQRLRQRRSRGLCQFTAAITCLSFPLGTVLGVFTFIVLGRPSVRAAFGD